MARRKTQEEFEQEVYELVGDEYTVIGEYKNNKTKILIRHNECGSEYEVKPKGFKDGNRCPPCDYKRRGRKRKTQEEFEKEVKELFGNEYVVIGKYKGASKKVKLLHNVCGKEWETIPNAFLSSGVRCYQCARVNIGKANRKTHEQFVGEVKELHRDNYTVVGRYTGGNRKVKVRHNICEYEWNVRANHFTSSGTQCPRCRMSTGELIVEDILKDKDIQYEPQKEFDDLIRDRNLSYDFYIPKNKVLIEYQGIQHYEPVEYFGGEERFKYQQESDSMKREYAKSKGYTLIEIPYTENTYEKIETFLISIVKRNVESPTPKSRIMI